MYQPRPTAPARIFRALVLVLFLSVMGIAAVATQAATEDPELVGLLDSVLDGVGDLVTESLDSLLIHDVEGLPVKEYGIALIERIDGIRVETNYLLVHRYFGVPKEFRMACNMMMTGVYLESLRSEYMELFGIEGMRDPDFDRRKIYLLLGELTFAHDSCARFLDVLEGVDESEGSVGQGEHLSSKRGLGGHG